jgi:ornithine cyclodeaminase
MRYISASELDEAVVFSQLVEGLRHAHFRDVEHVETHAIQQDHRGGTAQLYILAAWQRQSVISLKAFTVFPEDPERPPDMPNVQAVQFLFDGRTGQPLACLDGNWLMWKKTAADSALGADYLARSDAETLLMVGAGKVAPHLIRGHLSVRSSLRRVVIWNRTPGRARRLADEIDSDGVSATATDDLEGAVRSADIVCCATMSNSPLIQGAWLQPGTHVDAVGGYSSAMREVDDEVIRRSRVYVDSPWGAVYCGDIASPIERGVIRESDLTGDLFRLVREECEPRRTQEEITFFKNGGGGHLDLMTAQLAYAHVLERTS